MSKFGYLVLLLLLSACTVDKRTVDDRAWHGVGMYYWRTSWHLTPSDSVWMTKEGVSRVYLRLFDVVMRDGEAMPSATTALPDSVAVPEVSIVPVVFVDVDVLRTKSGNGVVSDSTAYNLGQHIARRMISMCRTHHIETDELQIDCDWTVRTQSAFFALLQGVRKAMRGADKRLSATIRLHQLAMMPPPADYGVLMLYNTGDVKTSGCKGAHNPILDVRDVTPYLHHLEDYELPLCAALPYFDWLVLYEGETFKGILYGADLSNELLYRKTLSEDTYAVIASRIEPLSIGAGTYDIHISPGQRVKVWRVCEDTRQTVRRLAEKYRPQLFEGEVRFLN